MRIFMLVYFWMMVALTFIRVIELACVNWPQERKPKSLGLAVGEVIVGLAMLFWAGILIWMR